jgi:hypothetical protein
MTRSQLIGLQSIYAKSTRSEMKTAQVINARTLADLFAGRVGRIRSGSKKQLSEECGAKLTDYLEPLR